MWPHQIVKRLDPELFSFLNQLNLSHLTRIFQKEEVLTMKDLLSLDREDLKDLGISKFRDAFKKKKNYDKCHIVGGGLDVKMSYFYKLC